MCFVRSLIWSSILISLTVKVLCNLEELWKVKQAELFIGPLYLNANSWGKTRKIFLLDAFPHLCFEARWWFFDLWIAFQENTWFLLWGLYSGGCTVILVSLKVFPVLFCADNLNVVLFLMIPNFLFYSAEVVLVIVLLTPFFSMPDVYSSWSWVQSYFIALIFSVCFLSLQKEDKKSVWNEWVILFCCQRIYFYLLGIAFMHICWIYYSVVTWVTGVCNEQNTLRFLRSGPRIGWFFSSFRPCNNLVSCLCLLPSSITKGYLLDMSIILF